MIFGMRGSNQHRTRIGLVFLVIGAGLLLWAWGSWIYRASNPQEMEGAIALPVPAPNPDSMRAFLLSPLVIIIGLLLVLMVLFGSHVFIRAARRYRALDDRKRAPTPADDVWAMNKLRNHDEDEL